MGFGSPILAIILMAFLLLSNNSVTANPEVNVLHAFRQSLHDPANVLHSWDPNLVNPCTWVHVTCDSNNSVVRLDLGNAQLSGPLLPELSHLRNLQYLELFKNSFNGSIPSTWGSFENLISLDLYMNNLDGEIPATLGDLSTLVFLRLNNNQLKGHIPKTLTKLQSLSVIDLSYNNLTGEVPPEGSFSKFTSASFKGNQLCGEIVDTPCPLSHVSSGTQS